MSISFAFFKHVKNQIKQNKQKVVILIRVDMHLGQSVDVFFIDYILFVCLFV